MIGICKYFFRFIGSKVITIGTILHSLLSLSQCGMCLMDLLVSLSFSILCVSVRLIFAYCVDVMHFHLDLHVIFLLMNSTQFNCDSIYTKSETQATPFFTYSVSQVNHGWIGWQVGRIWFSSFFVFLSLLNKMNGKCNWATSGPTQSYFLPLLFSLVKVSVFHSTQSNVSTCPPLQFFFFSGLSFRLTVKVVIKS